jgi:hypothetical protein
MLLPNAREARRRVRAYFEERDDPLISAIGWVTEAIGLVGGEDILARPNARASKERQIESAAVRAPTYRSRATVKSKSPKITTVIVVGRASSPVGFSPKQQVRRIQRTTGLQTANEKTDLTDFFFSKATIF